MDLIGFSVFTLAPIAFGMYFSYIFAAVKGMNRVSWTIAGAFSVLVPIAIFFKKPKENRNHRWFPKDSEQVLLKSPALLRTNPKESRLDIFGYLYLLDDTIRWVPNDNIRGYEWDYSYGLELKSKRTYKDALLTWLLLPNVEDKENPFAISLGTASGMGKLNALTNLAVLMNQDQDLMEMRTEFFGRKDEIDDEDN
jgi:hypothetical protein